MIWRRGALTCWRRQSFGLDSHWSSDRSKGGFAESRQGGEKMDNQAEIQERLTQEEDLVAELSELGIRYLSRQTAHRPGSVRPPDLLLADLVRQPSARVRSAVIAVLLAHPEYADAVPAALPLLGPEEQSNLRFFYLAAVLLQQEYAEQLRTRQGRRWRRLPRFQEIVAELDVPAKGTPRERLARLGHEHRRQTAKQVNWAGTYEQTARQLLRQWEVEARWSR